MMSPAEFAAKLEASLAMIDPALEEGTKLLMDNAKERAQRAIGTYEFGWPQLAETTQFNRVRLGFSANEPLLRTGEMRDSINTMTEASIGGAEGLIYSGEKKALWAEMGTSGPGSHSQPPRSFLYQGLLRAFAGAGPIFARIAERIFAL